MRPSASEPSLRIVPYCQMGASGDLIDGDWTDVGMIGLLCPWNEFDLIRGLPGVGRQTELPRIAAVS